MAFLYLWKLNYNARINGGGRLQKMGFLDAITPSLIFKEIFMAQQIVMNCLNSNFGEFPINFNVYLAKIFIF